MKFAKILPAEDSVLANFARENAPRLMEQAIKALVAGAVVQDEVSAEQQVKKPSLGRRIASAALVRVATKSVPGAILVSGGLLAKALYDRHQAQVAAGIPRKQR